MLVYLLGAALLGGCFLPRRRRLQNASMRQAASEGQHKPTLALGVAAFFALGVAFLDFGVAFLDLGVAFLPALAGVFLVLEGVFLAGF